MTRKEKIKADHPDWDDYQLACVFMSDCPSDHGLHEKYEDCDGACTNCWNKEIPDDISKHPLNSEEKETLKPVIKDSGDRTEFATGAVRDMREGKGRCDLMPLEVVSHLLKSKNNADKPIDCIKDFLKSNDTFMLYMALEWFVTLVYKEDIPTMLLEVAKHFEEGAKKYGENNWQKGIPPKCYIDSAVRHYLKWLRGDKDEPHDRAFVWNLMCCIWEVDYREKEETTVVHVDYVDYGHKFEVDRSTGRVTKIEGVKFAGGEKKDG